MADKTSIKSTKVARKGAVGRAAGKPRQRKAEKLRKSEPTKPRTSPPKAAKARKTAPKSPAISSAREASKPALLSGGNPKIAKGYGDAPVQAYIAAMPGWKRNVGRRLDALIVGAVPAVRKAVKWNSPLYGVDGLGAGWFIGIHCFTRYIKVAFFRGTSLAPVPPGASKGKDTRYLDIHEDDKLDEAQFSAWVKQASELPGERM